MPLECHRFWYGSVFLFNIYVIHQITLVGLVVNKLEKVTDVNFTLDDGTGRIDVHRWWVLIFFLSFCSMILSGLGFEYCSICSLLGLFVCLFFFLFYSIRFSIGFVTNVKTELCFWWICRMNDAAETNEMAFVKWVWVSCFIYLFISLPLYVSSEMGMICWEMLFWNLCYWRFVHEFRCIWSIWVTCNHNCFVVTVQKNCFVLCHNP